MARLLIIPGALLVLLAGAMVWSGGAAEKPADFTFINRGDIITLDPNQRSYLQDIRMALAMWEGLYTYDAQTLEPIPGCASGADVNANKTEYTFHIRPDAKWSNGDPVTTADFVFAWRRMLESPGEYTYLFFYINNAEQYVKDYQAFLRGERSAAPDFSKVGIEPIDQRTLRVRLHDPVTFFLDLAAFAPFLPLHQASMKKFEEVDSRTGHVTYDQKFTRPPSVVTNGPFKLTAWDFKRRLRLEANPYYWDRAHVRSKSIEMVVVEDPLTQLMRYDSGSVQWLAEVPSEIAADLKSLGRKDLESFEANGTNFITIMMRPKLRDGRENPLADIRVRAALAMSIDKQQIVENITRMGEKPATTYIPPDLFPGWRSTPGYPFDVARARQLLAEAGYPNGGRLPGVTYLFRSETQAGREAAQNYVGQWKKNLGLDIPLEGLERKIARARLNDKDYTLAGANWYGDYSDPSTFTDKYRSSSANNDSGWANSEYDALLDAAAKESDTQKRLRILEHAERILNEQIPIIPLYILTNQYLFDPNRVKGINLNPRNMTMFKAVEVVKR
jgi:oligopeptide transport system substrate-binding protein